jgi:hypothetical protein
MLRRSPKVLPDVFKTLVLGSVVLGSLACQSSAQRNVGAPPPGAPYPNQGPYPAVAAPNTLETYYAPQALRQLGSALLFLPGSSRQQLVSFETVDGVAILEGDILLGPATALPFRYGIPWQSTMNSKSAVALANRSYLWPGAEIPYAVDSSAQRASASIDWAVQQFNGTALSVRPRTAADRDYVVFRDRGVSCSSYLGRQGGPQDIDISGCSAGSIVHELLHAAGFYHEQSRGDRDEHVTIMWDEISPEMRLNFEKRDAHGQDIGPYDYGSIMHYPGYAGSKSGRPTIVPRVPSARIGQRENLSPLDRAGIETLYRRDARAPSAPPPAVPIAAAPMPAPAPVPAAAPIPVPAPSPVPSSVPVPAPSVPPSSTPPPTNASFTGTYSSTRGNVSCSQGGVFAQCQYPGGTMFCAASGAELACTWSGGGQGRAAFQRQPSGVLAGTWGDGFSATSRGRWDLVPLQGGPAAPAPSASSPPVPAQPAPVPAPAPPPPPAAPPAASASLSGNYSSTRGPMACVESGASVSCNFQEADGVTGRLDCAKGQNGLELSCAWITFLPRPATGRAAFTRASPTERRLTGTWGHFLATTGGGSWDLQGQ